ncbi:MAG: 6-phosphogluconolactonase, partial [Vicinamibacterales bacterium]
MASGSRTEIRLFADLEELSEAAAGEFCGIACQAIAERGRAVVTLSGGSTPRRLYELLTTDRYRHRVAWDRVEFFWGDERAVPPDHSDSNYRMARQVLLAPLAIPTAHIHRIEGGRNDLDADALTYEREIARVFGVLPDGPPPAFDLVLLGMGTDGHTASLFPGTDAGEDSRWVVSQCVPAIAASRVTMTPRLLNAARHVMFLVAGTEKAHALALVLDGARNPQRLPAQ